MEIARVYTDSVAVGDRHRALDPDKIKGLADSLATIGLQQPITVWVDDGDIPHLIAGLHRLEAARALGWEEIDASVVRMSEVEREMWEIAENLHRIDLTKDERDRHIRRYVELLEERETALQSKQNASIESKRSDGRGHRPKGVARKVAEQTGISVDTVRRAINPRPKPEPRLIPVAKDWDDVIAEQKRRLMLVWNGCSPEVQRWFREEIIDTPVMDAAV